MLLKNFKIAKFKVLVKNNIVFSLEQSKNWGYLQLRINPMSLKRRRNSSTEERIHKGYSGLQSHHSAPTAPCFISSGTNLHDEVYSGSASFCFVHICSTLLTFYVQLCNSFLLKSKTTSIGLLGNQFCSLCKIYLQLRHKLSLWAFCF